MSSGQCLTETLPSSAVAGAPCRLPTICPFPPPIRELIETPILLHSRGLPAERQHRGLSGTPSRVVACRARPRSWQRRDNTQPPPMRLLGRCPWRDRRANVPARRRFPARLAALRFDGLRAPPAMSRRFDRSQVPLLPVKNACSTERRTA